MYEIIEECRNIVVGIGDEGAPCSEAGPLSFECRPELTCVTEGSCGGRCTRPSAHGEACSLVRACEAGYLCVSGACVRTRAVGEACAAGDLCEHPLACIDGRCSEGRLVGEACSPEPCRPGLACTDHICRVIGTREGERCEPWHGCDHPLVCHSSTPGEGHPETFHTCTRGVGLGEPCDGATPCGLGGRCVGGACREIVSETSQCDIPRVCPATHDCIESRCVLRPDPCGECDGWCVDGACVAPIVGLPCAESFPPCGRGLHCAEIDDELVCVAPCE